MASKIMVGDKAPDFTLPDTNLKLRSLKDFLGRKIVLVFFVNAFTPVCTKEMCAFRDSIIRLTNLGTQVIGISVNDLFSNKAFAQKNRLAFPLLSDYNREIIRTYGIESPEFDGLRGYTVAKRSIFILDKNGVVCYAWTSDNPTIEPDYDEIEHSLEELG